MLFSNDDPFQGSLMARSAAARIVVACAIVLCLWGAVYWAISLP